MRTAAGSQAPEWTIHKLLRWSTSYFASHEIDSPRAAAEILLAESLGLERIDLYLRHDQPLIAEELQRYKVLIKRRLQREPVAYIVGRKEFWSMALDVCPAVLIPRPETECLVEKVLERLVPAQGGERRRVLELGTGSGAAILAVASERPAHDFYATDRSAQALSVAVGNARRHALDATVRFVCADWFSAFNAARCQFDVVFSNPPYIPRGDIPRLQPEIHRWEPLAALDGGTDGLDSIRVLIEAASGFLRPGGWLLLEIGDTQAEAVRAIARGMGGYADITVSNDYGGRPRVAGMRRPVGK